MKLNMCSSHKDANGNKHQHETTKELRLCKQGNFCKAVCYDHFTMEHSFSAAWEQSPVYAPMIDENVRSIYASMTPEAYKARNLTIINRARAIHGLPSVEAKNQTPSAQDAPIKGHMHSSRIVHHGRHVKTTQDGTRLYAPSCLGMKAGSVAYLGIVDATALVTCKRCLAHS